jgi:hypothetical protein
VRFQHQDQLPAEEMAMGNSPISTLETIWLRWGEKLILRGPKDPIVFTIVTRKEEARGEKREDAEQLLKLYGADLERLRPGYLWGIDCHEARPALKYIIRGNRNGSL